MTSTSYHSGERTKRSSPSKQNLCFEQQHARDTIGRSSSNFPPWLWSLLVKVAGMKLDNGNYATSTHCSLILYIITCLTSIVFSTTQTWYTIDGVLKSQRTPLQGVLRMVVTILWCWVGIYSPKLVYRLLSHPVIRDGVRWPSQAVFRLNVAGLVALLCVILVVVSNYSARTLLHLNWDTSGNTIQLKNSLAIMVALEVTYASQLLFSIVILFWNLTVVFILLSTCRTYTIEICRFTHDLQMDAATYDRYSTPLSCGVLSSTSYNIFDEYIWLDDDKSEVSFHTSKAEEEQIMHTYCTLSTSLGPTRSPPLNLTPINEMSEEHESSSGDVVIEHKDNESSPLIGTSTFVGSCIARKAANPNTCSSSLSTGDVTSFGVETDLGANETTALRLFSNDEILHRYWKTSCRLRLTSSAYQCWMACFLTIYMIWAMMCLICWIPSAPMFLDIVELNISLILVLLILSAYAEVHFESQRLIKYFCPVEERFLMLNYLNSNPLQMTVYNFPVTYKVVASTFIGVFVTLASGAILKELKNH